MDFSALSFSPQAKGEEGKRERQAGLNESKKRVAGGRKSGWLAIKKAGGWRSKKWLAGGLGSYDVASDKGNKETKNRGSASMNAGPPGLGACLSGTALTHVVFSVASHTIFLSSLDFMSWSNDASVGGYQESIQLSAVYATKITKLKKRKEKEGDRPG